MNWVDLDKESCLGPIGDRDCEHIRDWLGGRNCYDGHQGIDVMSFSNDTEVYPMRRGRVFMARDEGQGYEVIVKDDVPYDVGGDSYQTFNHLDTAYVVEGQFVDPSTLIGKGGRGGGRAIHIGHYTNVKAGHPLDGDFRIPPHATRVKSPFGDRMWTSFEDLGTIIEELDDGSQRQIFP